MTVDVQEDDHGWLLRALHEREVENDVRQQLGDRIAVSGSGVRVCLYADSEQAARAAQQVVERVLREHRLQAAMSLDRWHHEEEEWVNADKPLPSTAAEHRAEHVRLERQETAESQSSGVAEWELRIELPTHYDADALANRLRREGDRVVRRWKFLLIGANDEDDARTLAERLQAELPPGGTIHVEPGSGAAWELMPRNPFAIFGGLAS